MPKTKATSISLAIGSALVVAAVSLAYWITAPLTKGFWPVGNLPTGGLSPVPVPTPEIVEPSGPPPTEMPSGMSGDSAYVPPTTSAGINPR